MNILFITNTNPLKPTFGAAQRSNIFLKACLSCGANVDIAYVGQAEEKYENCPNNAKIVLWNNGHIWKYSLFAKFFRLTTIKAYPSSFELEHRIDKLITNKKYDYIICRYIPTAAMAGLYKYRTKLLLDIDDLPYQATEPLMELQSNIPNWKKYYRGLILQAIKRATKKWIKHSRECFLPNKDQAKLLNSTYLPNIPIITQDHIDFHPASKVILFIGLMSFAPNYKSIDIFIDNILPIIIDAVPQVRFLIAGKGLPTIYKEKWEKSHHVEVLGFVKDIYQFYNQGNIVVCPIYMGAGTNIKVLEAMSMGKACVLSEFSTRGFEDILIDGTNSEIARNYVDYANKVIKLLTDEEYCKSIGLCGYATCKEHFSQENINTILQRIIK